MRPTPPAGYVRFEWVHVPGPKGSGIEHWLCPNCGKQFQGRWGPSYWQDPEYQRAVDIAPVAGPDCDIVLGVDSRKHWSRYTVGECGLCHCKLWWDHGGNDPARDRNGNPVCHEYYLPTKGQLALF